MVGSPRFSIQVLLIILLPHLKVFILYLLCVGNEKIWIADRTFAPIASKGHISPVDGFTLQNVLHVSKISYNLLHI